MQEARAYAACVVPRFGSGGITILAAVEKACYSNLYPDIVNKMMRSRLFPVLRSKSYRHQRRRDYSGGCNRGSAADSRLGNIISQGDQTVLHLKFHSGEIYEYRLSEQDDKTYLDENRYYRTYSNSPLEECRPECL